MTGAVRVLLAAGFTVILASGCASGPATAPTFGSTASASPVPTPTIAATPSPAPQPSATSAPPQAKGWRPVPDQDALENLYLQDVAWSGTGFIAVGTDFVNGGTFGIDSPDGVVWHRVELDAQDAEDLKVAAGPRGILVLGIIDGAQATWVSSTGVTWANRRAAFTFPPDDVDASVNAVLATDDGWLAVGHEFLGCNVPDCGDATIRPIVWTSGDGIDWTRVSDQSALGHGQMVAVARGGPGYVAVGSASAHAAAVWTSTDGQLWSRVQDAAKLQPPADAGRTASVFMSSVAAAGHEVVAAGGMGELQGRRGPAAWWSPDGTRWSLRVSDLVLSKSLDPFITAPGGFLALGPRGEDRCLGGLWSSTTGTPRALLTDGDGSVWSCAATDPTEADFVPLAGAASGEIVVLVGSGAGKVWVQAIPPAQ